MKIYNIILSLLVGSLAYSGAVSAAPPIPYFDVSPFEGAAPLDVTFYNFSFEGESWEWDFDNDGVVDSTEEQPVHSYLIPGSYTPRLTAINNDGSASFTLPYSIIVHDPNSPPKAAISILGLNGGFAPQTIRFEAYSTGGVFTSCEWDFDNDGVVESTDCNTEYTFTTPAEYTTKLTISGPGGEDSITTPISIKDPNLPPEASFTVTPEAGSAPLEVNFIDRSTGGLITAWEWDFDNDGVVDSTEQGYAVYNYQKPGNYTAKLTVTGPGGTDSVTQTIEVRKPAPPPNDNFADAIEISGVSVSIESNNLDATKEMGEPNHDGLEGGASIWWKWSAPSNDPVEIHVNTFSGSMAYFSAAVYTGTTVDNLQVVDVQHRYNLIHFIPEEGKTYHIAVDEAYGEQDFFTFNLGKFSPPANDNFSQAAEIVENTGKINAHNIGATSEFGEPDPTGMNFSSAYATVWWKWTATSSDPVAFNVSDTKMTYLDNVYTGESLQTLMTDGIGEMPVFFKPNVGETYYFSVDSAGAWSQEIGTFKVSLSQHPVPGNNDFSRAEKFELGKEIQGHNVGSTLENGEPTNYGDDTWIAGFSTVWYTYTALSDAEVSIQVKEKNFDLFLGVFSGPNVNSLTKVANGENEINMTQKKGETYYIVVNGIDGDQGDFTLKTLKTGFPWSLYLPLFMQGN